MSLKGQKLSCWSPGTKQGGPPFHFYNRVSWALPTFYTPGEAVGASAAPLVTGPRGLHVSVADDTGCSSFPTSSLEHPAAH